MALAWAKGAWAAETVASLTAESSTAASTWEGMGLWAGVGAAVLLGVLVAVWLLRSRSAARPATGVDLQGDATGVAQAATPRAYSPLNVGNDASARPWERNGPDLDAGTAAGSQGGMMISSAAAESPCLGVPVDFDVAGFLKSSKANFLALQDAWDRSDIAILRAMMTDGMLEQIKNQLAEREQASGGAANATTEVVMLNAHLLGIEEQGDDYMASVEFSGVLREDPSAGPNPFRELWSITRPKVGGGGWLVAGVQALQ
jgi:predicted lipid-binding transport protein (Tim44 family)